MTVRDILMSAAGSANGQTYVDDVFSTYLYTGTGSVQTITNGIDLTSNGGMVWLKDRTSANPAWIMDTVRGVSSALQPSSTNGVVSVTTAITSFNSSGFSIGTNGNSNTNTNNYVSWTFRKAPKFFDIVTYTGNGSNRTINHSLGSVPGMIIIKRTDTTGNWITYHRSLGSTDFVNLNTTAVTNTDSGAWNNTNPTSTQFTLGTGNTNVNGGTYVAYLFAHDTNTDGLVQCGTYTGNGVTNEITVGMEPQFLLIKSITIAQPWVLIDVMRGMTHGTDSSLLRANSLLAEYASSGNFISPTATGFKFSGASAEINSNGETYIYMAIRRSNKPPTTGTQVYQAGSLQNNPPNFNAGFPVDMQLFNIAKNSSAGERVWDRLRGNNLSLYTGGITLETSDPYSTHVFDRSDGVGSVSGAGTNANHFSWMFKRATGFFDEACYTGDGTNAREVKHNLTVAPEFIIVRRRDTDENWLVYHKNATTSLVLNGSGTSAGSFSVVFGNGTTHIPPSTTAFTVSDISSVNASGGAFIAYMFASLPGISKIGGYTGNGSTQTIDCGFTGGARFILIKRTSATGNWFIWDTVRGIVSGNDPYLSLNTTTAEITTDDSIDPDSSGFIVNQVAATNINVTSATYIYLAIA